VLVDTGHHYQAQNIEQIVAWLLDEDMLGGFHFNDRRYADDDLTLGSIDPYQVFRIFHEICFFTWERGAAPDIAYMVDQSPQPEEQDRGDDPDRDDARRNCT
jgi:L-rhamnose isomerase / sugar isomerase